MKSYKKVYIIAEIGINHNNSLDNCYKLIDSAAYARCDAAKFQAFTARTLYPKSAGAIDWRDGKRRYSYGIYNAVKSFELPARWFEKLMRYCSKKGVDFLSSVFDEKSADILIRYGMKQIKIPSYSITNLGLLEHCARYKLPIIMSTGGATLGEVEDAVSVIRQHHNKLALLHCSIKYPTRLSECNLSVIETLRYAFPEHAVGYSDHTKEISDAPVQAVYLGARIIEKHITLDKNMSGPDHFFALDSKELAQMVTAVRKAEKAVKMGDAPIDKTLYGSSAKKVFGHEKYLRDFCFGTIFAISDIKKGKRIRSGDLRVLRPAIKARGLDPKYITLFRNYKIYAAGDIARDEAVSWEKILNV